MQQFQRWLGLGVVGVTVAVLVGIVGCSGQESVTGSDQDGFAPLQVVDPLNGVLDSTDGMTPHDPEARIERLAEVLGLDDEQKAQLLEAYQAFHDALADLSPRDRDAVQALREALEAELQVILTEEQYDLLQEMRAARHGHGRHGRDFAERWAMWLAVIEASEEQIADIMAAHETLRDGVRALHDQVRAGELTHEEARPQVEALRAAFDAELQTILTEEQYAQLQQLRPDCRRHD